MPPRSPLHGAAVRRLRQAAPTRWAAAAVIAAVAVFWLAQSLTQSLAQAPDPPPSERLAAGFYEREVLALVNDAAQARRIAAAAAPLGYEPIREAPLRALGLHLAAYRFPAALTGRQAIEGLERLGLGGVIGVNHVYRPAERRVGANRRDYGPAMIGWPPAGCPSAARIGLIDAAVLDRLDGPTRGAVREKSFLEADDAPSASAHGAEIASLLIGGGARPGLLPKARLFVAAVAERTADGATFVRVDRILRAMDWLAEKRVRVVNVSLAGPNNRLLRAATQAATARGLLIVAAAGNQGPTAPPAYPAALKEAISATAVDARARPYARSNQGAYVDLAAPGVDVLVGPRAGAPRYRSGTSFAAPFVAATLAASLADPETAARIDGPAAARRLLAQGSRDLGAAGRDPVFGDGLIAAPRICG